MTNQGFGSGSVLSAATGTIAGVSGSAALLPKTGGNLVIDALIIGGLVMVAMFASMIISKVIRTSTR